MPKSILLEEHYKWGKERLEKAHRHDRHIFEKDRERNKGIQQGLIGKNPHTRFHPHAEHVEKCKHQK